jgi:hypothetical protein
LNEYELGQKIRRKFYGTELGELIYKDKKAIIKFAGIRYNKFIFTKKLLGTPIVNDDESIFKALEMSQKFLMSVDVSTIKDPTHATGIIIKSINYSLRKIKELEEQRVILQEIGMI